jgi:hypothetical protein
MLNAQGKFVTRIWQRLPGGELQEQQLDTAIIAAAGIYEGDLALASAIRGTLTASGAVTVRQGSDGALVYRRAERLPEWKPIDLGTEAFNANLKRASDQEQQRLRELDRQREREFENSPLGIERQMIIGLVNATVAEPTAGLRAELDQLREQIAELQHPVEA